MIYRNFPDTWNHLQKRIVRLVAQGLNDREIAAELLLNEQTAERLVQVIMRSLGLSDRLDLMLYGIVRGMAARTNTPRERDAVETASAAA